MKKVGNIVVCGLFLMFMGQSQQVKAQIPIVSLVTGAIKKVIVAIDLKVQQLQNQTIVLQNAEKELENKMALGNLNDISGWLDKERSLYKGYYDELQQVKTAISDYDAVKRIIQQQAQLVSDYKKAYSLFRQDKNFSAAELNYMGSVYSGILRESANNLNEVILAITSFSTQMSDAQRLQLIHRAGDQLQQNANDLHRFNTANLQLSLQRANELNDMNEVRQLYGLPNN